VIGACQNGGTTMTGKQAGSPRRRIAMVAACLTLAAGLFASSFAALGLWEESVETFSLMLAAVSLSLAVGVPLGVLAGRSARFNRVVTPVLDAMQIIPAFAYLMPVVILFSVGPGAADRDPALAVLHDVREELGSGAAAQPDIASRVRQGFIEKSNVNSVTEMSRMIEITRTYTQISALLTQQSDLHKSAIEKLADVPA